MLRQLVNTNEISRKRGIAPAAELVCNVESTRCPECDGRGYKGRVGIYEVLEVNREIRELINKHVSEEVIVEAALKNGMTTLMGDGIDKISAGITTLEEVVRVTGES